MSVYFISHRSDKTGEPNVVYFLSPLLLFPLFMHLIFCTFCIQTIEFWISHMTNRSSLVSSVSCFMQCTLLFLEKGDRTCDELFIHNCWRKERCSFTNVEQPEEKKDPQVTRIINRMHKKSYVRRKFWSGGIHNFISSGESEHLLPQAQF